MLGLFLTIFSSLFLLFVLFINVEFFFILNLICTAIFSAMRLDPTTSGINVFGISVYMEDIFFISQIIFITIFIFKQFFENENFIFTNYHKISIAIFFLIAFKILISFINFGTSAVVSGRSFLYFFSNILFFSVYKLPENRIYKIYKGIFYVSFLYIIIGLLRMVEILPGIYSNWLDINNFTNNFTEYRYFEKPDLEVLLIGSFFSISHLIINKLKLFSSYSITFIFQGLLIIFSNTRSIVGIFLLLSSLGFLRQSFFNKKIILPLLFLIPFLFFFLISFLGEAYSFDNLLGENSTLIFRGIVNIAYIAYMNQGSYIYGMNFGDEPIVFPEVYYITYMGGMVGLHNAYVELMYYIGLPFLIFILKLTYDLLKRLYNLMIDNKESFVINISFISITSCLILFLAWPFGQFSGLIFGLSIASVRSFEKKLVGIKK
tara:strand:+ start:2968 stop:4266 length:1299 start_codon:yes stop_codon:yes gene_type:complete